MSISAVHILISILLLVHCIKNQAVQDITFYLMWGIAFWLASDGSIPKWKQFIYIITFYALFIFLFWIGKR